MLIFISAENIQQFSCMQGVPAATLEAAVISTNAGFNLVADSKDWEFIYPGWLIETSIDVTVFTDAQTRAANGDFLRVPMLGGSTQNEDDVFMVGGELVSTGFAKPVVTEMISDIQTLVSIHWFVYNSEKWAQYVYDKLDWFHLSCRSSGGV